MWVEGFRPDQQMDSLTHEAAQALWSGRLVYRRKLYPAELRDVLSRLSEIRLRADYGRYYVSERYARQAVEHARAIVAVVAQKLRGVP